MRIIAGQFRGRKLLPPAGEATRPVTDRVKQSVFDVLAPLIPDAVVFDCFAGTGSMGLECLSRGARRAVFFESDRSAAQILRKNIALLGVGAQSEVHTSDLMTLPDRPIGLPQCTLLFLDPPYRFVRERADELRRLAAHFAARSPSACVIFRHDAPDALDLPPLARYDLRRYGSMVVEFLSCPSAPTSSSPPPTPHA